MTFDEILDQVITLLKRQGRVSYPALKRRFALDDNYLEDLKAELFYVHPVVDDDGKGLLWTGEAERQPVSTSTQPAPQEVPPTIQLTQAAPLPHEPPPPEAERRQLTVMFCDLVDSTKLSSQLDPEEYRDVVRAYQRVCTAVIQRYDGHIAQLLGDGLLVYFGYPQAHEDDAQRAVRTGLGILAAMRDLNTRLQQAKGIPLALRIGIHTGLVVVGAMGSGDRQEHLALGETPNIAARIQGLAAPNTVAIGEATNRLVQGYFECQDMGAQALRGVTEAMHIYHVLGASGATGRLDIAQPRGLTPLVGRASEVTLLLERWEQAKAGQGQVVLLTGDAGIGKSRLVQVLKDHVANEPHVRWECRSAEYSQNTALFPLVDLFQRLLWFETGDTPDEKLGKLEHALSQYRLPLDESVPLFAPLLSLLLPESRYTPLNVSPQRQRQKTLEAIVTILLEHAERQPVLLIIEDLHWTDPTTLEFLNLMLDQTPTASLLTVLTCRPTFQPRWTHRSFLTEVSVTRLAQPQIEPMITHVAGGKTLPQVVMQQLIERTDGVPLFVEEMTKVMLESGSLTAVDDYYELTGSLSTFAIPATLQDSLMARLDRLVTAKAVAQYAAVIGRHFAYDVLAMVSQLDAATLQRELGRLVEAEIVYQRGVPPQATYIFKHALIQDAAYQSLLKSMRQHYHQRIAHVLESQFPETTEGQPELLAHHYTEAGLIAQAIPCWQRAGQQASDRSANVEAISHFTTGIEILKTLPETPEHTQEALALYIGLGSALWMTKGHAAPEVEHAYTQAYVLCQQVGETPQLAQVLHGLWRFYNTRAQLHTAREFGETLLRLAQRAPDPALAVLAHYAPGATCFYLGALQTARQHLEAARQHLEEDLARSTPDQRRTLALRHIPGVSGLFYTAWILWLLGYPDQALTRVREALALVHELSHPYHMAISWCYAAFVAQFRRDVPAVHEEVTAGLSAEHGSPVWRAVGTSLCGWAQAMQGQGEEGLAQVRQGIASARATGAELFAPYLCTMLAEVADHLGHPTDGLQALAEAHTLVEQHDERWWEAEIHRLRGVLLQRQTIPQPEEAEVWLQRALDVAHRQEAKSLELRAATSLARLWQQQGKRQDAHDLLAPVYNWFTEGFDTTDLKDAKALLDELA